MLTMQVSRIKCVYTYGPIWCVYVIKLVGATFVEHTDATCDRRAIILQF